MPSVFLLQDSRNILQYLGRPSHHHFSLFSSSCPGLSVSRTASPRLEIPDPFREFALTNAKGELLRL